ncbi:uncharacterized protein LOC113351739 [Papaver somniferum]|uniref:uncharacterized protein LOC113351739 n=1 Tax=Papaver somniferum TaxID=3469 RepID=UPI000E704106|nr:uncharacterized protein LOC113351739 [Papaver somniferum]
MASLLAATFSPNLCGHSKGGISVVPTTTVPRKLKVRKSTTVDAHKVGPSRPYKDRRSIKQKKEKKEALRILQKKKEEQKKKDVRRIPTGVVHVQSSFNNTIVTVTDVEGRMFSWSSSGSCKFENTKKGTPLAAQTAAEDAIRKAVDRGSGIRISIVRDVTPMPHNGCIPPKKRRV